MQNEFVALLVVGVLLFGCVGGGNTAPSAAPSIEPSMVPSAEPSVMPTEAPTAQPSAEPTIAPGEASPAPVGDDLDVVADDSSAPAGVEPSSEPAYDPNAV